MDIERSLLQNASRDFKANIDGRKDAYSGGNKAGGVLLKYKYFLLQDHLRYHVLEQKIDIAGNQSVWFGAAGQISQANA